MNKSTLCIFLLPAFLAAAVITGGAFSPETVSGENDTSWYYSFPAEGTTSAPYMLAMTLYQTDQPYKVVTIDWKCDQDAENTYWCAHNWYNSSSDYSQAIDGSGYAGFQNLNGHHVTIFSLWNNPNGNSTKILPLSIVVKMHTQIALAERVPEKRFTFHMIGK